MSTAVMTLANNLASKLGMGDVGQELMTTLKATAFKGNASDAQFTALMIVANQYSLNPWTREIYAFPDKNNGIVPVVGVDGWARIVNENPQFDGMDFEFADDSCTCIIYRKDRNHPIRVTEYMSECKRGTQPWQSHPKRMLRHKAMIQAARLAFGYGGIFDQDEAERIIEKDIPPINTPANNQEAIKQPVMLDDATFHAIAAKYKDSIVTGAKTVNDFVIWVEKKGALMTDEQKEEVASWTPKKAEVIEGEATTVTDDFTEAYEQAEKADK